MKHFFHFLVLAAFSFVAVSCSNIFSEEIGEIDDVDNNGSLTVYSSAGSSSSDYEAVSLESNRTAVYTFEATSGQTYYIEYIDNSSKSGTTFSSSYYLGSGKFRVQTPSGEAKSLSGYSSYSSEYVYGDGSSTSSYYFTATETGTYTISIRPRYSYSTFSSTVYIRVYSTSSSSGTPITTTANGWTVGNIASSYGYIIYSFNASSYTNYSVYMDDYYGGSGSYTLDAKISAGTSSSSPTSYFSSVDSCYSSPRTLYTSYLSSGTVYIKVEPYSSGTGTFAIKVQTSSGTIVPLTVYSSYGTNSGGSSSTLSTTSYQYSNDINDFTVVYLTAGSSKTYTFYMTSSYYFYLDIAESDESQWLKNNGYSSAASTTFTMYDSSNNFVGNGSGSSLWRLTAGTNGYWSITITASTSGYVALRMYKRSTSSSASSATVYSSDSSYSSGFTQKYISSGSTYEYTFYATAGKTYNIHWIDSNSSSTLSIGTRTSGLYLIYDSTGISQGVGTYLENNTFTPTTSGTYTFSIQTFGTSTSSGYVGFRIYTN